MTTDPELEEAKERPWWQYGQCRYCKHEGEDWPCEICSENPDHAFRFEWAEKEREPE